MTHQLYSGLTASETGRVEEGWDLWDLLEVGVDVQKQDDWQGLNGHKVLCGTLKRVGRINRDRAGHEGMRIVHAEEQKGWQWVYHSRSSGLVSQ